MPRHLITAALALALTATLAAPGIAAADEGAVCLFSFKVRFEPAGEIVQTDRGTGSCLGSVAGATIDPTTVPATISGVARAGLTSCAPVLIQGRIAMQTRRLISFSPRPDVDVTANWAGSETGGAGFANGRGFSRGRALRLSGTTRFSPAAACTVGGFGPGTIQMEYFVDQPPRRSAARVSYRR